MHDHRRKKGPNDSRYVDDTPIMYTSKKLTANQVLESCNKEHKAVEFNLTDENNERL